MSLADAVHRSSRRAARAICGGLLLWLAGAAAVSGQTGNRALDMEIAEEFLALELAGWRLPNPVDECLTDLDLKRLEPMAFGSSELVDVPELVDPPGPFYRLLGVAPEASDRRRRLVNFQWFVPGTGGGVQPVADNFIYAINDLSGARPAASMVREPQHLIIRRECFGG
ncbi:MAG: hypothetical protein HY246_00690 [Proteobacteria bacterium]|nr:hypothetical protein [Pseudomonadota bacterium]